MSFGPTSQTSAAMSGLQSNAGTASAAAPGLISSGTAAITPAQNFFTTLLNGNSANTAATLQPNINQIRQGNQEAIQSTSTLAPRGGGRSGSLFSLATAPNTGITNLFNNTRTSAATALPQIGATELGAGTSLLNTGNQGFGTLGNLGQTQQQITNSLWSNLGKGIMGLVTTPFGGGSASGGLFGLLPALGGA